MTLYFLIKYLHVAGAIVIQTLSSFVALVIWFPSTKAILTSHGFAPAMAVPFAAITSLMDLSIGVLIAFRRTDSVFKRSENRFARRKRVRMSRR